MLGLEPNVDAKTIKLAYSRLLKRTRPDEDPEGFQRLREAYDAALAAAQPEFTRSVENSFNKEVNQPGMGGFKESREELEGIAFGSAETAETVSIANERDDVAVGLDADWSDFIASVKTIVALPDMGNRRKDWKELLKSPILVDLQYRNIASERIFCLVADACLDRERRSKEKVNTDILEYLNEEFQWETDRNRLLARFGTKRADAVFNKLDEKSVDKKFWLVGCAGSLRSLLVILCGYFSISFFAVVMTAAVFATMQRLYVRRWQVSRQGFSNGGDIEFLNGNRFIYVALVYIAMCISEALFYSIGWVVRFVVNQGA